MQYDIVCLLETHCSPDTSIDLQGFTSVSLCRPKFRNARKFSGGVSVLIKNELKKVVSVIKSKVLPYDLLWLKVNKNFVHRINDMYICVTYLSPVNSSFILRQDIDLYSVLENEVVRYSSIGDKMLVGDLNSRTANEYDFIANDGSDSHIPVPDGYISDTPMRPRYCQDKTLNGYGRKLLNLCKSSGLRILNGRKFGDLTGRFTCHEYGGSSTVDYILAHHDLYDKVQYFKVNTWFGHLSDHCMAECGIEAEVPKVDSPVCKLTPQPCKYKWYKESPAIFKKTLLAVDMQHQCNNLLDRLEDVNLDTNVATSEFNIILQEAGNRCLTKTKNKGKKVNKQKWFDRSCILMKQQLKKRSRKVAENPFNHAFKIEFYKQKKEYKKILKWKKKQYKENIIQQLEALHSRSPSEYWSLVKELQNHVSVGQNKEDKVPPDEWFDYFQRLLGNKLVDEDKDNKMRDKINEMELENMSLEMDQKITMDKIDRLLNFF